jgi:hypothetical protein
MVKVMHDVVFHATKDVVKKSKYISMSCDELTTIDNQTWLFVHAYVMKKWKKLPILLNLQKVVDGSTTDNLTSFISQSLVEYEGLNEADIANKLICFGVDGVMIFHGVKSGVTTQLMQKHAPFVSDVHSMAHYTNLAIQSLSGLNSVSKIQSMLTSISN